MIQNPWVILGAVGFWLASLTGLWFYRGHIDAEATKAAVEAVQVADAEQAVKATQQARNEEMSHAAAQSAIDQQHLQEVQDAKAQSDRLFADLRSGAMRVRQRPVSAASGSGLSGAAAAPAIGDGSQATGLSTPNAEFLLRLGAEADDDIRQLAECQAVVTADRKE